MSVYGAGVYGADTYGAELTLWPVLVELNGVALDLDGILSAVTIHTGRAGADDAPQASTCQITLLGVTSGVTSGFDLGDELVLSVSDGIAPPVRRFTGELTDAALDDDTLTMIGVGRLATLAGREVGLAAWPAETWSARVTRVFVEAGLDGLLALQADATFDPMLVERVEVEPLDLSSYLGELAEMVGAAIVDLPDGRILVQAIGARIGLAVTDVDPADVLYSPLWTMELPGSNVVTVTYGDDLAVTMRDEASIAQYGREIPSTIDTAFVTLADAEHRARDRLARVAWALWTIPAAPILTGLQLELGAPVFLTALPPASPYRYWTPVVEGWTDTIEGDAWSMELALSHPLFSGLALPWEDVPTEYAWDELDPTAEWRDALQLPSILP